MQKIVDKIYQERGKHIDMIIRCGNVSRGLKSVAKKVSAAVIFIGTKGVRGIQNYTGSHALKRIMDSSIPFRYCSSSSKKALAIFFSVPN